jgi:hypothetical protein
VARIEPLAGIVARPLPPADDARFEDALALSRGEPSDYRAPAGRAWWVQKVPTARSASSHTTRSTQEFRCCGSACRVLLDAIRRYAHPDHDCGSESDLGFVDRARARRANGDRQIFDPAARLRSFEIVAEVARGVRTIFASYPQIGSGRRWPKQTPWHSESNSTARTLFGPLGPPTSFRRSSLAPSRPS